MLFRSGIGMNKDDLSHIFTKFYRSSKDEGAKIRGTGLGLRSEERRVGKECRSRWSPYH